jgi:hypothetical protein
MTLSIEAREYLEREAPELVANEVRKLCERLDTLKDAIGMAHEATVEEEKRGLTKEEWRTYCRSTLENRNRLREQLQRAEACIGEMEPVVKAAEHWYRTGDERELRSALEDREPGE